MKKQQRQHSAGTLLLLTIVLGCEYLTWKEGYTDVAVNSWIQSRAPRILQVVEEDAAAAARAAPSQQLTA
jgi:hypothetical protein